MTPPFLTIEPLTRSTFAPFGSVMETEGATRLPINQGTTIRFDALTAVDVAETCRNLFEECDVSHAG